MFLAVWRNPHSDSIPFQLNERIRTLLVAPDVELVEAAGAILAGWRPTRLRCGQGADGFSCYVEALGCPTVCVGTSSLVLDAGPLPQYPVYYARSANDAYLVASSRLEPLARILPEAPLNAQRLVSLCAWPLDLDENATVYAGIKRLRPCEKIVARPDGIQLSRLLPSIGREYRRRSAEDFAVELREQLDAAVGRAIGTSRRVAVFASGGLDSSGVLALAAARCQGVAPRQLEAISLQFSGPGDDRPYLAELAEALGLAPLHLSVRDAGKWLRPSLCVDAQPVTLSSTCVDLALSAEASNRNMDVALTGVGGDRICGGTLPFAQLARRGHPIAAVIAALRLRLPSPMTPIQRVREFVISPLIRKWRHRIRRPRKRRPDWLTPRSLELFERCEQAAEPTNHVLPDSPDAWFEELCTRDLLPDVADLGGQVAAATGCAALDAFMDYDFVRTVLEVDPLLLYYGHEFRGLYRMAMKDLLPERVRTRQDKASFEWAVGGAMRASGVTGMLRDLSSLEELSSRGLVDPNRMQPLFQRWFAAIEQGESKESDLVSEQTQPLWQLLSVEAFVREHGRGRQLV